MMKHMKIKIIITSLVIVILLMMLPTTCAVENNLVDKVKKINSRIVIPKFYNGDDIGELNFGIFLWGIISTLINFLKYLFLIC